jgi:hypothetical protein
VYLYDSTSAGSPYVTTLTPAGGAYSFSGLPAKNYYMYLAPGASSMPWSPGYYSGIPFFCKPSATPIAVSSGATTSVDATLTLKAPIVVNVHREGHPETPVEGAEVWAWWMGVEPNTYRPSLPLTDANGIASSPQFFPGSYKFWCFPARWPASQATLYGPFDINTNLATLSAGATTTVDIGVPLKPVTTSNAGNGWHKAPFLFQLTVADGDRPPFTSHINLGPGGLDADLSSLNYATDASETVWFYSKDASHNVEATKSVSIKVDATSPESTRTAWVEDGVNKYLTVTMEDELSGPGNIYYWIDGGPGKLYGGPVAIPAGSHTIMYQAFDAVGNADDTETVHASNPLAVVLGKPSAPSSVRRNRTFKISGSISPLQRKGDRSTKIYGYRIVRGAWVLSKTTWATSVRSRGKSRYSANIKLPTKGSWKFVAYSPGAYCGRWPGSSAPKFITVR